MPDSSPEISLRYADSVDEVALLEPLWNALQEHHASIAPSIAGRAPSRAIADAWRRRRAKYERWLEDPGTFFVIAEAEGGPVGYAFVTVGPGYASWEAGERLAELETLSVLPEHRGAGLGAALIDAAWERLEGVGVEDMQITTAIDNVDSRRFYEREGFAESFVVHYGRRGGGRSERERPATDLVAELHRRQGEMYAGGSVDPVVELLAGDVVWHVPGGSPIAGDHRGVPEVIEYFERRRRLAGATMRMRPGKAVSAGDTVVQFVDGDAVLGGEPVSWRTIGAYRVDLERRRIQEVWLVPLDSELFDRVWSP